MSSAGMYIPVRTTRSSWQKTHPTNLSPGIGSVSLEERVQQTYGSPSNIARNSNWKMNKYFVWVHRSLHKSLNQLFLELTAASLNVCCGNIQYQKQAGKADTVRKKPLLRRYQAHWTRAHQATAIWHEDVYCVCYKA